MRNDNCTTCGGFGYTIDTEGTMTGCFECYVEAQEADAAKGKTLPQLAAALNGVATNEREAWILEADRALNLTPEDLIREVEAAA